MTRAFKTQDAKHGERGVDKNGALALPGAMGIFVTRRQSGGVLAIGHVIILPQAASHAQPRA